MKKILGVLLVLTIGITSGCASNSNFNSSSKLSSSELKEISNRLNTLEGLNNIHKYKKQKETIASAVKAENFGAERINFYETDKSISIVGNNITGNKLNKIFDSKLINIKLKNIDVRKKVIVLYCSIKAKEDINLNTSGKSNFNNVSLKAGDKITNGVIVIPKTNYFKIVVKFNRN